MLDFNKEMNALVSELGLPTNDLTLVRTGIWTDAGVLRISPFGLELTKDRVSTEVGNIVQRARAIRLLANADAMRDAIETSIRFILKKTTKVNKVDNFSWVVEGVRVIVTFDNLDEWRINLVTNNVTKLIDWEYIIQPKYAELDTDIDILHSILIQTNLV